MTCRTPDEAYAAGQAAAATAPPLTQAQADYVAAVLAAARPAERHAA